MTQKHLRYKSPRVANYDCLLALLSTVPEAAISALRKGRWIFGLPWDKLFNVIKLSSNLSYPTEFFNKNDQRFEKSDDIKVTVENLSIKILKSELHHYKYITSN